MRNLTLAVMALATVFVCGCNKKKASALTASSYLFSDDFNRADESLSASADWTVETGTIVVSGQKAQPTGSICAGWHSAAVDVDQFLVSTTISVTGGTISSSSSYVTAKFDSPSISGTGYYCGFSGNQLTLFRGNSSVASSSATQSFTDGKSWTLSLTQVGNDFTCAITGSTDDSITYTDSSPLTGQYFGFATNNSNQNFMFFDDYQIGGL